MSLTDLLGRVESAAASEEWGLLHDARKLLVPLTDESEGFHRRLVSLLDAGGFESAALALVERVLPGWNCSAINLLPDPCEAYLWQRSERFIRDHAGKAKTPALALLAALLKARIAQEQP